jgi:uncharacterized protein YndB with AHSA1/START domain
MAATIRENFDHVLSLMLAPEGRPRLRSEEATANEEGSVAPLVESIEIRRRPEEVFPYITDPARLTEWQESVVRAHTEGGGAPTAGSRLSQTRRIGRVERTMTMEVTEHNPPRRWAVRGIDGPVRMIGKGTVEPLEGGAHSRVTIELDFEGHGIGKLLVPLVVRRQARRELPRNQQALKERLESVGA